MLLCPRLLNEAELQEHRIIPIIHFLGQLKLVSARTKTPKLYFYHDLDWCGRLVVSLLKQGFFEIKMFNAFTFIDARGQSEPKAERKSA